MQFAAEHGLKIGTIADLIQYRSRNESLVQRVAEREIDTPWGGFHLVSTATWRSVPSTWRWCCGKPDAKNETLVRVHEPLSVMDLLDAGQEHALVGRRRGAGGDPGGRLRRDGAA